MIDIPALARQMVPQARRYLVDRPGVYEVHFADDEVSELGPTPLWRFISDWELDGELKYMNAIHAAQFVGIVGDGCAVLYRLPQISANQSKEQSA